MASPAAPENALEPSRHLGPASGSLGDSLSQVHILSQTTRPTVKGYIKLAIHGRAHGYESWSFAASLIIINLRFLPPPDCQEFHITKTKIFSKDQSAMSIHQISKKWNQLYLDILRDPDRVPRVVSCPPQYVEDLICGELSVAENYEGERDTSPELTVAMLLERKDDKPFALGAEIIARIGHGNGESTKKYEFDLIDIDPNGGDINRDMMPCVEDSFLDQVQTSDLADCGSVNIDRWLHS